MSTAINDARHLLNLAQILAELCEVCVECEQPITVKQYMHRDKEGRAYHLLSMDCPALVHDRDCTCADCACGDFDDNQQPHLSRG